MKKLAALFGSGRQVCIGVWNEKPSDGNRGHPGRIRAVSGPEIACRIL
jgi:hypothetical protein